MRIGGIGNDENPFLNKLQEEGGASQNINNADQSSNLKGLDGSIQKTESPNEIKKPNMEEGAASSNMNNNQNSLIDRSQFTSDDELQEIDLQEFEDDFQ